MPSEGAILNLSNQVDQSPPAQQRLSGVPQSPVLDPGLCLRAPLVWSSPVPPQQVLARAARCFWKKQRGRGPDLGRIYKKVCGGDSSEPVDISLFYDNSLIVEQIFSRVLFRFPRVAHTLPRVASFSPHTHFLAFLYSLSLNLLKRERYKPVKRGESECSQSTGQRFSVSSIPQVRARSTAYSVDSCGLYLLKIQPLTAIYRGIHGSMGKSAPGYFLRGEKWQQMRA